MTAAAMGEREKESSMTLIEYLKNERQLKYI